MNDFEKLIKNLNFTEAELLSIVKSIFDKQEIREFVLKLNTEEQLFDKGIGADGQRLNPDYSPNYLKKKQKLGLPSHVSLYLKGTYLENWKVRTFDDHFTIGSDPVILNRGFDLHSWLKKRYGSDIEGFTQENLKKIQEKVTPLFYNELEKRLLQ